MQKKKLIILISLIIIILIIGLITSIIYLKTDLLKSNKQLFFKYLIEENEMWNMISLNENKSIDNNKSYTSDGTIDFFYEYGGIQEYENDNISKDLKEKIKKLKNIENIYGNITSNVDKTAKKENYKLALLKNESNFINIELVRDVDKYAFKSDEILKAYIGIENNNVNNFLKKMEIADSKIIPDKIDTDNIIKTLFELRDEDRTHIYQTYKNIFVQSLDKKNYKIEKNKKINIDNIEYNVNIYSLILTKTEYIELISNIIQVLKQDSITLNFICNKIKAINPESKYANIKNLVEEINIYSEEIKKIETNENEFIRIDVYADKNNTKRVDLVIENSKQLSLEYDNHDGIKNLQISQNNIFDKPTQVNYNIKDALLSAKKIKITKNTNNVIYQIVLYNIKDIYKNILDNIESSNFNDKRNNLDEIKKIYNFYKSKDDKEVEISINLQLYNEENDETKNIIYLLVGNSKIGAEINNKKIYTNDLQNNITLNNKNSLMINNYSKEIIDKLLKIIFAKERNILNKEM